MANSANVLHELNPPSDCSPRFVSDTQVKVETATAMARGTKGAYRGATPAPIAVVRRNARERNRVKQLNNGYATLRSHIPASVAAAWAEGGSDSSSNSGTRKLSKVETLRLAVEYIKTLQDLLASADSENYEPTTTTSIDPNRVIIDLAGEHLQMRQNQIHSPSGHHNGGHLETLDMVKVENVDSESAFDCTDWWTDEVEPLS